MISLTLFIEIILATVISSIMYVSITYTNGNYLKNVLLYSLLSTIVIIILGLRGGLVIFRMWIVYVIEGIPMIWIMNKLYDNVDTKYFIIISSICWFIAKIILSFIFTGSI